MTLLSWFATESVYTAPARRGWTCHPAWNGDDSEDAIGLERWLSRHGSTIPGIKNSTIRISRDVRENDSDTMFPCVNLTLRSKSIRIGITHTSEGGHRQIYEVVCYFVEGLITKQIYAVRAF
ncbi:hypothetical protein AB1N83_010196 [Pleurotus pulmonarius]